MSGKSSSDKVEYIDWSTAVPATREEWARFESFRPAPMTMDEYVAFLKRHPAPSYEELRKKEGPRGPPFTL